MNIKTVSAEIKHHLQTQQWQAAIRLCQQSMALNPKWTVGYHYLGQAYTGIGKIDAALRAYRNFLQGHPNHAITYGDMGLLYQKMQQRPNAIAHYQKALSLNPNLSAVQFNLAIIYHQLEDWDTAIAQYEHLLRTDPDHVKARFNLAILYEATGSLAQAEQAYQVVLQRNPTHFNAFNHLGKLYYNREQYDAALAMYHCALELQPDSAQTCSNIGQVYLAQENREAALQMHQKAIAIDPLHSPSRLILGRLWLRHQQFEKAQLCFQLVLEQSPTHLDVVNDLGLTHVALHEWPEALSCFRQLVLQQSEFVELFCRRLKKSSANDWHQMSQQECGNLLQRLQEKDDPNALEALTYCHQYLGQALLTYGAPEQAEQQFHQALALTPQQVDLYGLLADSLMKQNRDDAAIAAISMGLIATPQHPELLRLRDEVHAKLTRQHNEDHADALTSDTPPIRIYHTAQEWAEAIADHADLSPKFIEVSPAQVTKAQADSLPIESASDPSTSDYCGGVTCHPCMQNLIQLFDPKPMGHKVFQCSMRPEAELNAPSTFVVAIPNGCAWISPQQNDWLVCKDIAILTEDRALIGDLSRFYPWYLPGCVNHQMNQHPFPAAVENESPTALGGHVAILSSLSGHVYYHWMIDVLPRIGLLKASGYELDSIDAFVVNSISKSYQRETLQTLGIPLEKVIESDRIPYCTAPQLIVPSFPGHLDWVPQSTISFLRQSFLPNDFSAQHKRIYISRSSAQYRQVVNEPEIVRLLEQFGFVSLNLEEFSVAQQAAIFSGADVIVAPHGAALTNLVFCQTGTKVVELFSPDYIRTDYWMISHQLQLEHYFIKGDGFRGDFLRKLMHQSALTEDMWITPQSLYRLMNHFKLEDVKS